MQTSEQSHTRRRTLIAGSIAATIAFVISPADPAMSELTVHPAWAVAVVLAARYGARGLYAVPAVVVGVLVAEWVAGRTELAMLRQLNELDVLAVIGTIVVVAAVGESHQARGAQLHEQLQSAELRATNAEIAVNALSEAGIALRDRSDRSQTSLAFLSDIALRLDDPDPNVVAQAVLEIAIARTGARGGFVQLLEGGRLRTAASRGRWNATQLAPPAVFRDRVTLAALDHAKPVAAHEVDDVSAEDSDVAAPLLSSDGTPVGVLALRGIAYPALTASAREDLAAVGRWAGRSLARPRRDMSSLVNAHKGSDRAAT